MSTPNRDRSSPIRLGLRDVAADKTPPRAPAAPTVPVRIEDRSPAAPRPVPAPRPTLHRPPRRSVRVLREEPGDLPLIIHMGDDGAFPTGRTYGPDLAGLPHRLVATLADLVILAILDGLVVAVAIGTAGRPLSVDSLETIRIVPMALFGLALALFYVAGLTRQSGQTLGKRLVRIRVVGSDDEDVSWARALLRAVGWLASVATLGLPCLAALFDDRRRTVHDRLAGTQVVHVRPMLGPVNR